VVYARHAAIMAAVALALSPASDWSHACRKVVPHKQKGQGTCRLVPINAVIRQVSDVGEQVRLPDRLDVRPA
jgi:hypothetical protein